MTERLTNKFVFDVWNEHNGCVSKSRSKIKTPVISERVGFPHRDLCIHCSHGCNWVINFQCHFWVKDLTWLHLATRLPFPKRDRSSCQDHFWMDVFPPMYLGNFGQSPTTMLQWYRPSTTMVLRVAFFNVTLLWCEMARASTRRCDSWILHWADRTSCCCHVYLRW